MQEDSQIHLHREKPSVFINQDVPKYLLWHIYRDIKMVKCGATTSGLMWTWNALVELLHVLLESAIETKMKRCAKWSYKSGVQESQQGIPTSQCSCESGCLFSTPNGAENAVTILQVGLGEQMPPNIQRQIARNTWSVPHATIPWWARTAGSISPIRPSQIPTTPAPARQSQLSWPPSVKRQCCTSHRSS